MFFFERSGEVKTNICFILYGNCSEKLRILIRLSEAKPLLVSKLTSNWQSFFMFGMLQSGRLFFVLCSSANGLFQVQVSFPNLQCKFFFPEKPNYAQFLLSPVFLAFSILFFWCRISVVLYVFFDVDYDNDVRSCPNLVAKKVMDIFLDKKWTENQFFVNNSKSKPFSKKCQE